MAQHGDGEIRAEVRGLWQRVANEQQRAVRAADRAARHALLADSSPEPLSAFHARLRDLHLQAEGRHRVAADLQTMHAERLGAWLRSDGEHLQPVFMGAVAAALNTSGAVAALRGQRHAAVVLAASNATAQAAHDLEIVNLEGPVRDASNGSTVEAAGDALVERWPRFGAAAAELGVRALVAVPLGGPAHRLGAMCAYRAEPSLRDGTAAKASRIADALTQMMLLDSGTAGLNTIELDKSGPMLHPFGALDHQDVVHQAAGMISVQFDCDIDDAEDLLVARAFADGAPIAEIARSVVRGETRFS